MQKKIEQCDIIKKGGSYYLITSEYPNYKLVCLDTAITWKKDFKSEQELEDYLNSSVDTWENLGFFNMEYVKKNILSNCQDNYIARNVTPFNF